jgi:hypothetical protein
MNTVQAPSSASLVFAERYYLTPIGDVEQGIDGFDRFWLVRDTVDEVDVRAVEAEFLHHFYRDTNAPGGYFCHNVTVTQLPHSNECVAIVHHRYDV